MLEYLSTVLKQKKTLIFILLFLVVSGTITPQVSYAFDWTCLMNPTSPVCAAQAGNAVYNFFSGEETSVGDKVGGAIGAKLTDVAKGLFMSIVAGLTFLALMVFGTLANLAGGLLLWVMAAGQSVSYTHITGPDANLAVQAGWPRVRDLANMFVVLGFVIVGIATALRIETYKATKLLPKLIIVALLINFSLLICGIFIDGSNMAMTSFGANGGYLERNWSKNVWAQAQNLGTNYDVDHMGAYIGSAVGMVFQDIMMIIIFLLFFFLLMVRYVALWILVILSPLAFVCYVFPFTKKFFDMWWTNFFQWCIIGVPATFFLWLSDVMGSKLNSSVVNNGTNAGSILTGMQYLVPGLFLLVGFLFSLKASAMGAGAAMSAFKWTGGKAQAGGMGALKGLGRGADAAAGGKLSSAGQKVSSGVGRAMENLGLRKTGATAAARGGELAESEKRYSALVAQGDLASVQRTARGEGMNKSPKERAGAAAALLKSKNFDATNPKEVAGLAHFQGQGGNLSEYSAKDPRLAYHDISATRNTMTKEKAKGNMLTEDQAAQKNVDDGYARLGVRGMRDTSAHAMDINFFRNTKPEKNTKASEEYSDAQITKQKQYITPGTDERKAYEKEMRDLRGTGTAEDMVKYRRMRDHLIEMGKNPNLK